MSVLADAEKERKERNNRIRVLLNTDVGKELLADLMSKSSFLFAYPQHQPVSDQALLAVDVPKPLLLVLISPRPLL